MGRHKDWFSGGDIVIETEHARIHAGEYFTGSYVDLSYGNTDVLDIVISTDGAQYPHVHFVISATVEITLNLYENTVFTGGTPLEQFNRNRASANVSPVAMVYGPTVSDAGSLLHEMLLGTGKRAGASGGFDREYVLAPETNYLIRMTNVSGGAGEIGAEIDYYINGLNS